MMIPDAACTDIAEIIGVLANPHRIRVLCALLDGEHSVADIAEAIDLPQAHTSSHLRVLYDRGLVVRRREWRKVFYRLRDDRVAALLEAARRAAA
jgi:ArsR family transcriptional regulator